MKKIFAILALLPSLGMGGQYTVPTFRAGPNTITTVPMTIDGSIHGQTSNGSGSSTTAAVTIGTPTAGDGIICEVSFSHSSTFVSVADNVNAGNYSAGMAATVITGVAWQGIYFHSNVAASPTTITLTFSTTSSWSYIGCQAVKPNSAGTLSVDSTFTQQQSGTTANPTTGSAITPSYNNELVIGLNTRYHTTATAGAGFTLIDASSNSYYPSFPEYVIQTTATGTNAPFVASAEATWGDMQAGFYFH